jgi:PKD repeat protein
VTAPTPSPLNVFSAPTSGTTGTTFTVGWSVANADTCIGTATLDNGALSRRLDDDDSDLRPRSVTLSTAGAYVLKLTCSNSAGSTTGSVPITVQNPGSAPTPSPYPNAFRDDRQCGRHVLDQLVGRGRHRVRWCGHARWHAALYIVRLDNDDDDDRAAQLTLSTAGVYAFTLDCSNETGSTSGSTGISVQGVSNPPTPNPLTLTPSSTTGNVGDTFSINWTVSGASSCTGTVTRDGSALSSLSGWTTTTATAGPRSVTLNTAGTYAFALNCSNSAGSTSGSTSIVVSTSGSDQCGQQQTGQVFFQSGNSATIDITKFENILGKASSSTTAVPFPGINMSPWITNVDKNSFIAAKFVVPATISTSKPERSLWATTD